MPWPVACGAGQQSHMNWCICLKPLVLGLGFRARREYRCLAGVIAFTPSSVISANVVVHVVSM